MMAPTTPTGSRTSRPNSPPRRGDRLLEGEGLGQTGVVLEGRRHHRCRRTARSSAARPTRGATPGRGRRSVPSALRPSPADSRPARRGTSGATAPCRMPPGRPSTALAMSASWASATVRKTSSLVESITRMVASEDGCDPCATDEEPVSMLQRGGRLICQGHRQSSPRSQHGRWSESRGPTLRSPSGTAVPRRDNDQSQPFPENGPGGGWSDPNTGGGTSSNRRRVTTGGE